MNHNTKARTTAQWNRRLLLRRSCISVFLVVFTVQTANSIESIIYLGANAAVKTYRPRTFLLASLGAQWSFRLLTWVPEQMFTWIIWRIGHGFRQTSWRHFSSAYGARFTTIIDTRPLREQILPLLTDPVVISGNNATPHFVKCLPQSLIHKAVTMQRRRE